MATEYHDLFAAGKAGSARSTSNVLRSLKRAQQRPKEETEGKQQQRRKTMNQSISMTIKC